MMQILFGWWAMNDRRRTLIMLTSQCSVILCGRNHLNDALENFDDSIRDALAQCEYAIARLYMYILYICTCVSIYRSI